MVIKIAIIGAGPAGCTLARLLQADPERVSVTVFESEASLNFRSQGGASDPRIDVGNFLLTLHASQVRLICTKRPVNWP